MNIHLSGPMSGIAHRNEYAFRKAEERLREMGYEVFNPINIPPQTEYRVALMQNLVWICERAEAQVLLLGSEASPGSCAERALANALMLPQYVEMEGQYRLLNHLGITQVILPLAVGVEEAQEASER